eukprot:3791326-Rhodomonas_salina.2
MLVPGALGFKARVSSLLTPTAQHGNKAWLSWKVSPWNALAWFRGMQWRGFMECTGISSWTALASVHGMHTDTCAAMPTCCAMSGTRVAYSATRCAGNQNGEGPKPEWWKGSGAGSGTLSYALSGTSLAYRAL